MHSFVDLLHNKPEQVPSTMNEAPVKMTSPCSIPPHSRRIDPTQARTATFKPDGSDNNNDCVEIGPTPLAFAQDLGSQPLHLPTMRAYRLQRICEQLISRDLGGILLFDPLNIRYATDSTNMQLWATHNPARACFVAASGYIVLLDFHGCNHLSAHLPLIKGAVAPRSSTMKPPTVPVNTTRVSAHKLTNYSEIMPATTAG